MPGAVFAFGPFLLDTQARRLTKDGRPIALGDRHLDVLAQLVAQPGTVITKNALIDRAWRDVAVTDNSLEQAISALRRALGDAADGQPYIRTIPRQGYRFTADVSRTAARASDAALDALLAPHRAWLDGRAALETLAASQVVHARGVFEQLAASTPEHAPAHVGLANACVMQFEMTRSDDQPDRQALVTALAHARDACRLDARYGEAWATLAVVLDRTGQHVDAVAAAQQAIALEPDNWRHHFRLAYIVWGEERLRAAQRTLALLPGFPLAHWLAATVHVARQAFDEADRELCAGIAGDIGTAGGPQRFSAVALHWLRGLVRLATGDDEGAAVELARELARESSGHLYTRECCANTWYAIGALHLKHERWSDAAAAFEQALGRSPSHVLAKVGLGYLRSVGSGGRRFSGSEVGSGGHGSEVLDRPVEAAICKAAVAVLAGNAAAGARIVDEALAHFPAGSAGWWVPVEPLLRVTAEPAVWADALKRLRARAL